MPNKFFSDGFFQQNLWHEVVGKCIEISQLQTKTIITLELNYKQVTICLSNCQFNSADFQNLKNKTVAILKTEIGFLLRELEPKSINYQHSAQPAQNLKGN